MNILYRRIISKIFSLNLFSVKPISSVFGFDRGTPIDRIYINDFLNNNSNYIKGVVCEIEDDQYSRKFILNIEKSIILHYSVSDTGNNNVSDLTDTSTLPSNEVNCIILTQTLPFIYDFKKAIIGIHFLLAPDGIALVTVPGISQISRYDMDRWGDYWRFTDLSIKKCFEEVFGLGNVEVETYGNVLAANSFLTGISGEEMKRNELFYKDRDYQVLIVVKATKKINS
jgi:hypothetical protein